MLKLIRLHNRPVPALDLGKYYLVGGDMLRMRAIYIYRKALDHAGMPTIHGQAFRAILSCEYFTGFDLNLAFGGNKGITIRFPWLSWTAARRLRFLGGMRVYAAQQWIVSKFTPDRKHDAPYWDVKAKAGA